MISNMASADVNRCAVDVPSQLSPGRGILRQTRRTDQFHINISGRHRDHIQGNARLRDWNNRGRMVLADSASDTGFHVAFQSIEGSAEGAHTTSFKVANRVSFDINNRYPHPGGIQAQGDNVIVAMQDGPGGAPTAFVILGVTGDEVRYISRRHFEPGADSPRKAGSAGLTRLVSGRYLVAIYDDGEKNRRVIRFYRSRTPDIGTGTVWDPAGEFRTDCRSYGMSTDRCLASAQGGVNFVTDCDGSLYLIAMSGNVDQNFFSSDHHWFQAFRVLAAETNGASVRLEKFAQQRKSVGKLAARKSSFRWSGSVYVDRRGRIHMLSSDRHTGDGGFISSNSGSHVGITSRFLD